MNMNKEENKCKCGGNHAWMIGQPEGAHYAVYDCGTWAFSPDDIGKAEAIAFAAENGMDVFFHHDTCGKQSDGVVWQFQDHFPDTPAGHSPYDYDMQAKVTFNEIGEATIHWTKRPEPPKRKDTRKRRVPRGRSK